MKSIVVNNKNEIIIEVDTTIYDESVISKVLYWLAADYFIRQYNNPASSTQTIILSSEKDMTEEKLKNLAHMLSANFVDYKNRTIINEQTKDLRVILYAKAFANSDSFIEFDFND